MKDHDLEAGDAPQQRDPLEAMDTKQLHDSALHLARSRLDLGFFWRLFEAVPAAEAAAGNIDRSKTDVVHLSSLVTDALTADEGSLGEALRPLYIDYLRRHGA